MSRLVSIPAIVLLFLCPAFSQSKGVLRSSGTVKVNGSPATSSTVIMEGDRIETDKHSSAILVLPGRMIALGSSSSAVFQNGGLASHTVASAKDKGNDDDNGQGDDKNKDKKKKCISPKKPGKDKDCDDDDDDHGHGNGNGNGQGNGNGNGNGNGQGNGNGHGNDEGHGHH
jgi:hypothetical protein